MKTLKFRLSDDWQCHAVPPCDVTFSLEEFPIDDHPSFCKPHANIRFRHARVRKRFQAMKSSGITHFRDSIVIVKKL
jgi:hypothetical protein